MKQWEYKILRNFNPNEHDLDELGLEGWECYQVDFERRMAYLKRPKQSIAFNLAPAINEVKLVDG